MEPGESEKMKSEKNQKIGAAFRAAGFVKKHKKLLTALLISAGALILIFAGLSVARTAIASSKAKNTTYTVKSEVYENVIEVAGTVSAAREQSLEALNDGTVVGVYVKEGDFVKKGDLILQEDDTEQVYNLAKLDYDIASAKVTGARRQIELYETQRTSLLQKIKDRKIVATFDGVIADLDVDPGDYLEAKDEIGTLVDKSYLLAEVEIAETDVSKLEAGQTVEFTFPAYSGGKVTGYVVGWPAIGKVTDRGATVVNAKLRIDDYPEEILPNYSFSGKIKIAPDEKYLLVSKYAVGREKGGAFVVKAGESEKIPVKVQPYDSDYVKILEGKVSDGDILQAQSVQASSGRNRRGPAERNGGMPGAGGPPPF